jgi:hypothetical protein
VTVEDCLFCEEPLYGEVAEYPIYTETGPRRVHWQCGLREVMGGIGHLIAHQYWCAPARGDPDAGLTRRQSALLVAEYVKVVGIVRSADAAVP